MRIYVHIKPNSSPSGAISQEELPAEKFGLYTNKDKSITALKVSVKSAPVDGQANDELIKVIAKHFKVPKSEISIVKGLKGRYKILEIKS